MGIREIIQDKLVAYEFIGHPAIIERFLLVAGDEWPLRETSLPRAPAKTCFQTSFDLATTLDGHRYVEGLAFCARLGMLFEHAWVVDPDGFVVDTVWEHDPANLYMGLELSIHELCSEIEKNGVYGVLDTGRGINVEFIYGRCPELETEIDDFIKDHNARRLSAA